MTVDWFEVIKLSAQLIGALIVARLTVNWALARYKSEKIWERRLIAYSDVVASLTHMEHVLGIWEDDVITRRDPSEEERSSLRERYNSAFRMVQEIRGTADILLPEKVGALLNELFKALESASGAPDWFTEVDAQWSAVSKAKANILAVAKSDIK